MKKIYQYILMAVAVVATASCSNELDEALQPASNGNFQFVISDFPNFGESTPTRASDIGTPDPGKTAWVNGDQIIVTLSLKSGAKTVALTYNGTSWTTTANLSYLKNEAPAASAIYAPCYQVTESGEIQLKEGFQLGMTEYLYGNCEIADKIMTITFEGVERNYSRLRIAAEAGQSLQVTVTNFTPAGATESGEYTYTLTADENGNAFLYGTFDKGATVTVKDGDTELAKHTFDVATEAEKSYALRAYQNDSDAVVAKFYELFYYENGNTKLVQMEEDATSWIAGVESGEDVCRIFNTITGAEEKPTDTYNYKYQSQDRSVSISVKGNLTANDEAVFAIMKVVIPNYPEVREIHLVNPDSFNGVSPGTVITVIL